MRRCVVILNWSCRGRYVSLSTPSWNQIMVWLREMAGLRESGIVAA